MGFFANLLGTDGVIDGIKDGVDKAILTEEERLDFHKDMLGLYEPFKLIQRYLALIVTGLFGFVLVLQVVLASVGVYFPKLLEAVGVINSLETVQMLGWGFVSIMSLYFSGGVINSFKGNKTK